MKLKEIIKVKEIAINNLKEIIKVKDIVNI